MRTRPSPAFIALVPLILLAAGCATAPGPRVSETLTAPVRQGPFHPYQKGSVPPKTKIFLIAGGSTLANFLQEVLDQRAHWIRAGYRASEIACYYVRPDVKHYLEDQEQFDLVGTETKGFYEARPELLYQHFAQLASESPKFIYCYTTSHGLAPSGKVDDYTLVYDKDPVNRSGGPHRYVRPAELRDALKRLPDSTAKYVVLQGCHTGGFLDSDEATHRSRTLKTVPNITVLAASRHDRTSFGCGATDDLTYYGSAFLAALKEQPGRIPDLDFARLARNAEDRVEWMEETHRVPFGKRSLPQYYTNRR